MVQSLAHFPPGGSALGRVPVALFGSVMSVTGLSVAWRLAHMRYGAPEWIAIAIATVAVIAFVLMVTAYSVKLLTALGAVREELGHPITSNLFGTVVISFLQLPIVLAPFAHLLAQVVWAAGAAGMVVFAWLILSRWTTDRQQVAHAMPAWITPVVGVLNVPLAMPALGLFQLHGVMVAALGIGLFSAVPLFTLVLSRLLFESPLPTALKPSLLFLVAPFAVGYSTYVVTAARTDLFAEALFMLTLFLLAILLGQLRYLTACCPFHISWWAVSFPIAACSVAALRFAAAWPSLITDTLALALLALATIIVVGLLVETLRGILTGKLASGRHARC